VTNVGTGGAKRSVVPPGDGDRVDVPADARAARLARRVDSLTRQLEARIAEIDDLERQLAHLRNARPGGATAEVDARKAAEYDKLMATITMRLLRRPRQAYATARRHLAARR